MVHHHRPYHSKLHQLLRKVDGQQQQQQRQQLEDSMEYCCGKKAKPRLYRLLLLLLSIISLSFLLTFSSLLPFFYSDGEEQNQYKNNNTPCSSQPNNTICCDRTTSFRTDVCFMRGDIRTQPSSSSIFLYTSQPSPTQTIKPYTRKWETTIMDTIDPLHLIPSSTPSTHNCDVFHSVPAVVFSTGGYTGNVYHEFNDGILPLYITSQHFNKQVVFVILEYHNWWVVKYGDILSQLSDYTPIDFSGDKRTHCFSEAIVGLRIHDELSIDPSQMGSNSKTILDLRRLLDTAYRPRIRSLEQEEEATAKEAELAPSPEPSITATTLMERPRLVIISRNGSRGIENEKQLVKLCSEVGFEVSVLRPDRTTELAKIYRTLNNSEVMIGVHGAAMTHMLFMRPRSVFIQIVPLGTEWAAEAYYGEPARKMGVKYVEYRIMARESSLYWKYERDDPVLRDPRSVTAMGWKVTKEVYLEGQNVRLDLHRFLKRITRAYQYALRRRRRTNKTTTTITNNKNVKKNGGRSPL